MFATTNFSGRRDLEEEHVPGLGQFGQDWWRTRGPSPAGGAVHRDEALDPLGVQVGHGPCNAPTPVVPHRRWPCPDRGRRSLPPHRRRGRRWRTDRGSPNPCICAGWAPTRYPAAARTGICGATRCSTRGSRAAAGPGKAVLGPSRMASKSPREVWQAGTTTWSRSGLDLHPPTGGDHRESISLLAYNFGEVDRVSVMAGDRSFPPEWTGRVGGAGCLARSVAATATDPRWFGSRHRHADPGANEALSAVVPPTRQRSSGLCSRRSRAIGSGRPRM